jgi:hypothetical protein
MSPILPGLTLPECSESAAECLVPQCQQCKSAAICLRCAAGLLLSPSGDSCMRNCDNGTIADQLNRRCQHIRDDNDRKSSTEASDKALDQLPTSSNSSLGHHSRERRTAVCGGSVTISLFGLVGRYTLHTNPFQTLYNNNMLCTWRFIPQPLHSVFMDITEFQTEKNYMTGTEFDTFKVVGGSVDYTGSGNSSITPSLLRQFFIPAETVVTFRTDGSVVRTGVKASLYWMCSNTTVTITDNNAIFGSNTAPGGFSPEPLYLDLMNCTWILSPQSGFRARVTFDADFLTESSFDFVTVYDGANELASQLSRTSGSTAPSAQTGAAQLTVNFRSDHSVKQTGFRATFSQVGKTSSVHLQYLHKFSCTYIVPAIITYPITAKCDTHRHTHTHTHTHTHRDTYTQRLLWNSNSPHFLFQPRAAPACH